MIRQFVRLARATQEYHCETGKHLTIYGALGELYGAMVWGIRLHRKADAEGSDGLLDNLPIEIKTIGPRSKTDRVTVKFSGNFNKLLVVKIVVADGEGDYLGFGFHTTGRMVDRRDLTKATSGVARIKWSRAREIGTPPPRK